MKDVIAEMIEVLRRHRVEVVIGTAELKVCSGEISFRCKGFPLKDGKTRRKEERAEAATLFMLSKDVSDANMWAASNFIRGAEWADKTMIDKAVKWLTNNWREYVYQDGDGIVHFGHWESDFRKAMEE